MPASASVKDISHSGFSPVSSRSRKIRENAGVTMPSSDEMTVVNVTKAIAVPAPTSRFFAYCSMDCGLPSGVKPSAGSKNRQMPVKESSKVCIGTE